MDMRLLITGRPGAGKGTQAKIISNFFNIPHISTGDIFRDALSNGTKLGLLAKSYMDKGELVPDELTIEIVIERLKNDDCKKGFLLDGFPRNLKQAEALDLFLEENKIHLNAVLDIDLDIDILVERMVGRRVCKKCGSTFHVKFNPPKLNGICDYCGNELIQRADDTKETALKRLEVYDNNTKQLLDYYRNRNILKIINGNQELNKVFEDIKNVLI